MKLFFDEEVTFFEFDKFVWVYSPNTNSFIKIQSENTELLEIVNFIIKNKGVIRLEKMIEFLKSKSLEVSKNVADNLINKLIEIGNLFYLDIEDLNKNKVKFKNSLMLSSKTSLYQAYLHLTHRCNFICWYCYNKKLSKNEKNELNTFQWIEVINRLKECGVIDFIITGGEPLLRKDILQIIRETTNDKIKFTILTNGSLFNEKKFFELVELIDHCIISLDSFSVDIQEKNRSSKGFQNIINAIKFFSENAPKKLTVRSVITQHNAKDIENLENTLINEYKISKFQKVIFLPNAIDEIELIPKINRELQFDESFPGSLKDFLYPNRCGASIATIAVDAMGDIYPCQNFVEEEQLKIGNILENDWYDKFKSSPIRQIFFNLSVDKKEVCKDCVFRYLCGGGCPAISWKLYKELERYLPFLCEHFKHDGLMRLINAKTEKKSMEIINF